MSGHLFVVIPEDPQITGHTIGHACLSSNFMFTESWVPDRKDMPAERRKGPSLHLDVYPRPRMVETGFPPTERTLKASMMLTLTSSEHAQALKKSHPDFRRIIRLDVDLPRSFKTVQRTEGKVIVQKNMERLEFEHIDLDYEAVAVREKDEPCQCCTDASGFGTLTPEMQGEVCLPTTACSYGPMPIRDPKPPIELR